MGASIVGEPGRLLIVSRTTVLIRMVLLKGITSPRDVGVGRCPQPEDAQGCDAETA